MLTLFYTFLSFYSNHDQSRGCSEGQSSVSSGSRKCLQSGQAPHNAWRFRTKQILLQPTQFHHRVDRGCESDEPILLDRLSIHIIYSICQGRYEVAMRDYKKGKLLLDTRPGQLLPISASKDKDKDDKGSGASAGPTSAEQQQQKRILDKVWANVEKAMGEMRNVLLGQLRDPGRSVEEQEKTLE